MANAYVTLDTLKGTSALNLLGTAHDTRLRTLTEGISRQIDKYCNRDFFFRTETLDFSGNGKIELFVPDLVAVTSLTEDTNMDGTFETTWATADYLLYPYNAAPTKEWGRPYDSIRVNTKSNGSQDEFLQDKGNYRVAGTWGYQQFTKDSGRNGTLSDGTATNLVLDGTAADLDVAQTILIESEQVYVTALAGTAATVERAKNGTTGTAHTDKDCLVVQYPPAVIEAALIQTGRLWRRKDSAFASQVGIPETGQTVIYSGLDTDVKQLLAPFVKAALGEGI